MIHDGFPTKQFGTHIDLEEVLMLPVEREFQSRGIERGGLLFLHAPEALAMISRCRENRIHILGVDAFRLTEETTQPVLDQSIDLSNGYVEAESWTAAEQFLRGFLESDLYFEIVLDQS